MKMFILFVYIGMGQSNFFSAEFNSKENCEAAGTVLEKKYGNILQPVFHTCVEK